MSYATEQIYTSVKFVILVGIWYMRIDTATVDFSEYQMPITLINFN